MSVQCTQNQLLPHVPQSRRAMSPGLPALASRVHHVASATGAAVAHSTGIASQFTPEQMPFWDQFESKKLAAGKGAVFLWDSRTVHSVRLCTTKVQLHEVLQSRLHSA